MRGYRSALLCSVATAAVLGGLAPATALASTGVPQPVTAGTVSLWDSVPNPPHSEAPSPNFQTSCYTYGKLSSQCVSATLAAINHARAAEGVGAMTLPSDYTKLNAAEQMFVVADLERTARRVPGLAGLNTYLDGLAQTGANNNTDPGYSGSVPGATWAYGWVANWADDYGVLGADYDWMYNDGLNTGNIDCTSTNTSGCWGHRENILSAIPGQKDVFGGALAAGASATGRAPASYGMIIVGLNGSPSLYKPSGLVSTGSSAPSRTGTVNPGNGSMRFTVPNGRGPVLVTAGGSTVDIGGQVVGGVSSTKLGSSTVIAVRGGNNGVYLRTGSYSSWGAWGSLGGATSDTPAVVRAPDGALGVLIRGTNSRLYVRWLVRGRWGAWTGLGGLLAGGVAATATPNGVRAFVIAARGTVYTRAFVDGHGWGPFASLGGVAVGEPTAVTENRGSVARVFVSAPNRALYVRTLVNNRVSGSWGSLGGVLNSPAAAGAVPSGGTAAVFAYGSGGQVLYHGTLSGSTWSGWAA